MTHFGETKTAWPIKEMRKGGEDTKTSTEKLMNQQKIQKGEKMI